jgi:hypothetical protein
MSWRSRLYWPAVILAALVLLTSCTRRQLAPGLVAGGGAVLATSGGIYRATLDTDEAFGETPGEVAATTILIFGGLGLLLTGVIWSITSNHCDDNGDCWSNDVCEIRSHTCIDADAARRLVRRGGAGEPDAGASEPDAGPVTGASEPDAGASEPDAGVPEPDAGPATGAGAPEPDASSPAPER